MVIDIDTIEKVDTALSYIVEKERAAQAHVEVDHRRPSLYRVIMLNDDFTPMDFVVNILQDIFNKDTNESQKIMLTIHQQGSAICGVYTYEIAEMKINLAMNEARKNGHPLRCMAEKDI